jgi:hypothetical protein
LGVVNMLDRREEVGTTEPLDVKLTRLAALKLIRPLHLGIRHDDDRMS